MVAAESKKNKKQCEVISTISHDRNTNLHTHLLILSMVYVCTCLYFFLARHWSMPAAGHPAEVICGLTFSRYHNGN